MYIGLISDTHCSFPDDVRKFLEPVDVIWHAGDFGNLDTLRDIATFKPLTGVYGNCDPYDVRNFAKYTQLIECEGKRILMMHIGGFPGRYDYKAFQLINAHRPDIFVCGHSHILRVINDTKYNMLSITAHKISGPQGIGAFIMRRDRSYRRPPVKPLMYGGQQERGYRPGTTPVALVAGFALAAQLSDKESAVHMESCRAIKRRFLEAVEGLNYTLNGDQEHCLPSTVNISFHGVDAEGIFLAVKEDYAFSNGSACNSGSHAPSYVLTAMGLDEARVSEAIRLSWNHDTKVDFSALTNYVKSMAE